MEEGLPRRLRSRLGRWFLRNARDLPWRGERRDPWAVLVSEVMLQQTRVEVVAPWKGDRYKQQALDRVVDSFAAHAPAATQVPRSPSSGREA
ncbi:MAG: hypothetical protein HUU06_13790 [Planctomycetaceae bacterium]|nr:hypothetical protein [Planctomycetaceae bacterium]